LISSFCALVVCGNTFATESDSEDMNHNESLKSSRSAVGLSGSLEGSRDVFAVAGKSIYQSILNTKVNPQEDFALYLDTVVSNVNPVFPLIQEIPQELIRGTAFNEWGEYAPSAILRSFFSAQENDAIQKEYLAKIIMLMWHIDNVALKNDEGFVKGSFKILDPEHKIYNFLLGYVRVCTGYVDPKSHHWASNVNNQAYRRSPSKGGSSHYKTETVNDEQFGVDMRFETTQTVYGYLPHEKRHILFGNVGDNLTFIKFEEVGIGSVGETLQHTFNFGRSVSGGVTQEARREKDIPEEIKNKFGEVSAELNIEVAAPDSISEMLALVRDHDDEKQLHLAGFTMTVQEHYLKDDLEKLYVRKGNEVILKSEDL